MSPHYFAKRQSSFVRIAVIILWYKCLISPVHSEISIHVTSIYSVSCLQKSVNLSDKSSPVINGWLWQEPVDVLCVRGRLSSKQRQMSCILQGSVATLFRWSGEFTIFWCEISSGFCIPKIIKIGTFFVELFIIYKGDDTILLHVAIMKMYIHALQSTKTFVCYLLVVL